MIFNNLIGIFNGSGGLTKQMGRLSLKDLKFQGIILSRKWIIKAINGSEPWKVLIRANLHKVVPKKEKLWAYLHIQDILFGNFNAISSRSKVFVSTWRA